MTKVIAAYLPQYHEIPENSKWWGEGYTDWVGVKAAKPQYKGHKQPRVPLNEYYDLSDWTIIKNQAELARRYGIYGFCIYHYWFNSDLHLLQKPAESLLEHNEIDINYYFDWDNTSWVRTWSNIKNSNPWAPAFDKGTENGKAVLAKLEYGNEKDWKKHFDYLLPFFKDERYIKIDNMPLIGIHNPSNDIDTIKKMCEYWNNLSREAGFAGVAVMSAANRKNIRLDYMYRYEPFNECNILDAINRRIKVFKSRKFNHPLFYNYDDLWRRVLHNAKTERRERCYLGAFVAFDDTPRRGNKARIIKGATPHKFEKYFSKLLKICNRRGDEYVFVTAWNEWGEGAYLEPDEENGYAYLEALKRAVESVGK